MSAVPVARVQFCETTFDDYAGIAALEHSQGLASKSFEDWRRLWHGNPCYEERKNTWPIGWVLKAAGRIVGCISNIPLPYVFHGKQLLVAAGRGWAVEDRYRSYAPMLMDEYFNQDNVDIFLNNTVNGQAAEAFSTFGSVRVPVGDWHSAAFAITGYRGFAQSALRIKGIPQDRLLSYPAALAVSIIDRLRAKQLPHCGIKVSFANSFDNRFDAFWERLRDCSTTLLADRSSRVLSWHFGAALEGGRIWILTAGAKEIDAYAIFEARDEPCYKLKRMRLIDFQACERHDEYCAAFTRRAAEECRARGIHVLEQVGCGLAHTRAFEQASPYHRQLPSWCFFYSAKDPAIAADLSDPAAWSPSSYDGDSSL